VQLSNLCVVVGLRGKHAHAFTHIRQHRSSTEHYGATKKANEAMAHAYASLFGLPATGLRFFTVYGPWGRPDMALWQFTAAIMDGTPVKLFKNGRMRRDFTYIADVTEAVTRLVSCPPDANPVWSRDALPIRR
jgi:UDP-glucuronate 4-epimerase